MSSKSHKRNRSADDEIEEATVLPDIAGNILSVLRAPFGLIAAHRWKVASLAVVAALGLAVGTGFVNVGALTSWATVSAPDTTAAADGASSPLETLVAKAPVQGPRQRPVSKPELNTCFTPGQNCVGVIVAAIDGAQSEILVQANAMSAKPLIKALGRAHLRGVKVRVILDKADESRRERAGAWLIAERILPQVDTGVATAHNKVMIIDRDVVVTGSFNFTEAAHKKNAENVLVIKGHPEVAAAYAKNWEKRLAASRPYYGTMAPVM